MKMLKKEIAQKVIDAALSQGGDFVELFFEDSLKNNLSMIDGSIENATTNRIHGAGIRVYDHFNSVYVYTNDTQEQGLLKLAQQAADALHAQRKYGCNPLMESIAANAHSIAKVPADVHGKRKAELLHSAYHSAKQADESIVQVQAGLSDSDQRVWIANSEGLFVTDRRIYTRMFVAAVASNGSENQTGTAGPGAMMGYELFDTKIDAEKIAREAALTASTMLRAPMCPAGTMPVVIDGGFGGVIFHEACGHSLEATSVALGNSEFSGKLGEKIAADCVTAIDDGTLPNEWGSINIDDEGTPSTRLVLIENGILKNYMVDRLNGRRMGMQVTGSARRQSYAYAPTSRMRNTFIAPGRDDEEQMIRTMGDGLYAKSLGGGSVNPVTGEFNFAVTEAYLVKDGKIQNPVRGATLIGKGSEVLEKIDRVGNNMWMQQGVCGSISGAVYTNVGQPRIRVSRLTVGGH